MSKHPRTVVKFSKVGNKISLGIYLTFSASDVVLVCCVLLLISALLLLTAHLDISHLGNELIKALMKILGLAAIWRGRKD